MSSSTTPTRGTLDEIFQSKERHTEFKNHNSPNMQVNRLPKAKNAGCTTTEKMAFWLDKDIKERPKTLAGKERGTASDIPKEV
ncbi:MAG: hypothetical protein ACE5I5_19370 [Candidatus Heimdallarchaeota archaeon]